MFREERLVLQAVADDFIVVGVDGVCWRMKTHSRKGKVLIIAPKRIGSPSSNGYLLISFSVKGVKGLISAHRLVWQYFNGQIPEGLTINHKNGVRDDNRLENLELATNQEQSIHARDVLCVGPAATPGENHCRAKLSNAQVVEIRERAKKGEKRKDIAKCFGVANQTVSKIVLKQKRRSG